MHIHRRDEPRVMSLHTRDLVRQNQRLPFLIYSGAVRQNAEVPFQQPHAPLGGLDT